MVDGRHTTSHFRVPRRAPGKPNELRTCVNSHLNGAALINQTQRRGIGSGCPARWSMRLIGTMLRARGHLAGWADRRCHGDRRTPSAAECRREGDRARWRHAVRMVQGALDRSTATAARPSSVAIRGRHPLKVIHANSLSIKQSLSFSCLRATRYRFHQGDGSLQRVMMSG